MELVSSVVKIDDENHIPLGKERILVVLPPNHDLAKAKTIKLADLKMRHFCSATPANSALSVRPCAKKLDSLLTSQWKYSFTAK